VTPQKESSNGLTRYLTLGIMQGLAAWSAYAVLEFLASSVVFRLGRPYARFTTWHWTLTGQLVIAYLAHGVVFGILAGALLFLFRNTRRLSGGRAALAMEHAATLMVMVAVTLDMSHYPSPPDGWWKNVVVAVALIALLLLAMGSEAWSRRLGLLTNPWMVAGLFLGFGQVFALEDVGVAGQLGISIGLWFYLLTGCLLVAAAAAVWLGRRWREAWNPDRIFAPNRVAVGLAVILMGTGFLLGAETSSPPQATIAGTSAHPNVILIVMDTVRADHLSLYGYNRDTTPNLKKLAADAAVYPEAISAADITLTSHASIFTGLYPSWHGAYCQPPEATFGRTLGPVPTMAEVLAGNGYHTLGVAANLYLRAQFGLQRGFADFRIPRPVPVLAGEESWYMLRNGMRRAINQFADTDQFDRLYSRGDAVNREFFRMLGQPELAQAPFFAFFNYMDAHFPYIPPHPFDRLFPGKSRAATESELDAIQGRVMQKKEPLPQFYTEHAVSQYDGGIAYIDSQIGHLVDWLKRQNLYDNTMIVVTADHGEAFGERRMFLHGNSLYANLLHVPLLVKYPHSEHAGVVAAPVSLIDIFPTVLDVTGVKAPPGLQGVDLLDPAVAAPRELFSESFPCPVPHPPECPGGCTMRSVVSWPNKFIWSSKGSPETYELAEDPNETHNLFGSLNKTAMALSEELKLWGKTMPAQAKQYRNMSPEDIKRFKALGYIQ
jgi:arylsulfatase A-like enzyme